jgi:hypothetical protein
MSGSQGLPLDWGRAATQQAQREQKHPKAALEAPVFRGRCSWNVDFIDNDPLKEVTTFYILNHATIMGNSNSSHKITAQDRYDLDTPSYPRICTNILQSYPGYEKPA